MTCRCHMCGKKRSRFSGTVSYGAAGVCLTEVKPSGSAKKRTRRVRRRVENRVWRAESC